MTGLSRAQLTRLVAQHRATGSIADRRGAPRRPFPRRYTSTDTGLLAELDRLHGTVSGPRGAQTAAEGPDDLFELQCRNLAHNREAGMIIGMGTDSGVSVAWTTHTELRDMAGCGLTPMEVIEAENVQ